MGIFPGTLQVILTDSYSVNSCNFGVLVGGYELRVFLLYHLGHTSPCTYILKVC